MKNTVYALAIIILCAQSARALEFDMLNLKVPDQPETKTTVLTFDHRFYGNLKNTPIAGANALVGFKYIVAPKIELNTSYTRYQDEYILGAGYQFLKTETLLSEINVDYFDYNDASFKNRSNNVFYQLSWRTEPIFKRFVPVVDAGYDGYNKRLGCGFGLSAGFDVNFGVIRNLSIIGEYYPIIHPDPAVTLAKRTFCCGVKIGTPGHDFALMASNNSDIGTRRLMLGAPGRDGHFGFNIIRKF